MRVDPNVSLMKTEYILCNGGRIELYDGSISHSNELAETSSSFRKFCESLDPNECFIVALVPSLQDKNDPNYDIDRELFMAAREAAKSIGIYMQSNSIDSVNAVWGTWENYKKMKQFESVKDIEEGSVMDPEGAKMARE